MAAAQHRRPRRRPHQHHPHRAICRCRHRPLARPPRPLPWRFSTPRCTLTQLPYRRISLPQAHIASPSRSTHHAGFFEPVWGLWPRSWTRQPERCPFAASLPAFSLGVLRRSGARTVAVGHQRTRRHAHPGHQHTRRIPQRTHHLRTRPLETRRGCRMGAAGVRSWAWGI